MTHSAIPTSLPQIGDSIADQYELMECISEGGMGFVIKAKQISLNRLVIVKVPRPAFLADKEMLERFTREARAAARITDQNVVTIHDFGFVQMSTTRSGVWTRADTGIPFIVMEWINGTDLATLVESRNAPCDVSTALDYVLQAASGLVALHKHGLVHRDIKLENLLLTTTDSGASLLKIVDLGIARRVEPMNREYADLTRTGQIVGSPYYMSPEQTLGSNVDERSDIWSLGVVLYKLVTGRFPFGGNTAASIRVQIRDRQHLEISDIVPGPSLQRVAVLVNKCLEKTPDERYPTAEVLKRAIGNVRQFVERRVPSFYPDSLVAANTGIEPGAQELQQKSKSSARLHFITGKYSGIDVPLFSENPVTIGCGGSADLVLVDETVSTTHARIEHVADSWQISDLNSSGGTYLNKSQLTGARALKHADVILIGTNIIRFLEM